VGWAVVGLVATAMVVQGRFGQRLCPDPEDAFGFACRQLLFPGGLGLMIAGVLAANMSTCSAFMVDSGALFTRAFTGNGWPRVGQTATIFGSADERIGAHSRGRRLRTAVCRTGPVFLPVDRTMATFMGVSFWAASSGTARTAGVHSPACWFLSVRTFRYMPGATSGLTTGTRMCFSRPCWRGLPLSWS
jgi:hypothetical protein